MSAILPDKTIIGGTTYLLAAFTFFATITINFEIKDLFVFGNQAFEFFFCNLSIFELLRHKF